MSKNRSVRDRAERLQSVVGGLAIAAVTLAIVGVIVGLRMALHATPVRCPDGTEFPAGTTDFRCFAREHAGEGTAIVLISVLLAILIVMVAITVDFALERPIADFES